MRASLTSYMEQVQQLADSGQMERHQEEVAKLGERLRELPNDLPEDQLLAELELIAGALKGMTANAGTAAAEIRTKLETEFQGTAESISAQAEAATRKADTLAAQFETSISRITRAATIENFAKMAGGIASVGTSIQQLQNLGSIWKNEDLTTGQKLLQTITNLAISLPMLTTGFTKAMTAMKLMEVTTYKNSAAAAAAITANGAHAVSLGAVGVAASKAGLQIQFFNTTLMINPFTLMIAGAVAAVAAFGGFTKAAEEARKAAIELDQATIDTENKKQEEIESTKTLLGTLQELDEQYENGEITRSDLKSTIQDLIDQYGLEGEAADNLAYSYNNLAEYIKKAREEAAAEGKESAERELAAAQDEVYQTAKSNGGSESFGTYSLNFGSGWKEPEVIREKMTQAGFVDWGSLISGSSNGTLTSILDKGYTTDDLITLYDTVQGIVDEIQTLDDEVLSVSDRNNSKYYTNMVKWLDGMSESVERYRKAQEDLKKYSTEVTAITAEGTGTVDFSNIENANQYLEQRLALIQQIQAELDAKGDTASDATAMADTYLRDNFRALYTQFDEYAQAIQKIRERFSDENGNPLVEEMLGELDEDQLSALMDLITLHPSVVKDWESLGNAIHYISEQDLSNVDQIAEADLGEIQAEAADKYNIYQSLEDQVSSGKTISKKEMESLEPEVQEFFSMMANGSYKMTGDAKEFYEIVNNLKLDGFYQTVDTIDEKLASMAELAKQNFNYDELNQSAYTTEFRKG